MGVPDCPLMETGCAAEETEPSEIDYFRSEVGIPGIDSLQLPGLGVTLLVANEPFEENGHCCEALVVPTNEACDVALSIDYSLLAGSKQKNLRRTVHEAAGHQQLVDACLALPLHTVETEGGAVGPGEQCRCAVGEAVLTPAFSLPGAIHLIHTVPPQLNERQTARKDLMRLCYTEAMEHVAQEGADSVGFSLLGAEQPWAFPMVLGASVAVQSVALWLRKVASSGRIVHLTKVVFYCGAQDPAVLEAYQLALAELSLKTSPMTSPDRTSPYRFGPM